MTGLALLAAGCGSGGGGPQGGGFPAAGQGAITGSVADGPVAGATVSCAQLDAAGAPVPPLAGQAQTGADGAFSIAVPRDVPGPLRCASSGGTDGGLPAPDMLVLLPDGVTVGATLAAHVTPFTTIAARRVAAQGIYTPAAVRALSDALAATLGLTGPLWEAAYGDGGPDGTVITRLLDGFSQAVANLNAAGGDPQSNATSLMGAVDADSADGTLNGLAGNQTVTVAGQALADVAPALISPPPGAPPLADAGADQGVVLGAIVNLDGGASSDPDGDPLAFLWRVAQRPTGSTAALTGAATPTPALSPDRAGLYVLSLVVNDGAYNSAPASVSITVQGGANRPPVANAGLARTIAVNNQVVLDGAASADPDGDPLTYLWTVDAQPAGAAVVLSSTTAPRPTFTPTVAGIHDFSLTVSDGARTSAPATVRITVSAAPNQAPAANAGGDISALRQGLVTLNGTASADPDGDPLTYLWRVDAQPAGAAIALSAGTVARPTFVPSVAGIYVFSLVVNDGRHDSPADTVQVTVSNIANRTPVANAGAAVGVSVFTLVTLDGSASGDPDGDPVTYSWRLASQPAGSAATLGGAGGARPTLTPDLPGAYTVTLAVSDGALTSAPASVTVSAAGAASGGTGFTFDGQAQNDWLGYAVAGPGDMNGDGRPDLAVGAPGSGNSAGNVQVFSGAGGALLHGVSGQAAGDALGRSVAAAGDVDADGNADLVTGAHGNDTTAAGAGMVLVLTGATGQVLHRLYGDAAGDGLGRAVAGAGDVNGDGHADLIAGAPTAQSNRGYARVFSGIDGGVFRTVTGSGPGEQVGFAVAGIGDIDGDGRDDVLVGAPGVSAAGTLSGQAVAYNGADGTVLHTLNGPSGYASFGQALTALGDVNGDGRPDFAVGAPNFSDIQPNAGRVIVYSGADATPLFTLDGDAAADQFGLALAGVGDVNGDAIPDLAVGAPGSDATAAAAGRVSLFSGRDGTPLRTLDGTAPFDGLGRAVAGAGDVNGDGFADVLTGAPGHDGPAADGGHAELVLGGP
ncbi:MAG: FG-GAP repeat protein [Nitrospirae bacterium]|nr:FG-GAP repeat protein [Nitrospirota bacterium]